MTASSSTFAGFVLAESRRLLHLSLPMMVAQSGLVVMGLVDTWCVGRVSKEDMAGVALGTSLSMLFVVVAIGVAMGLEPLIAQAHGAGEYARTRAWRIQGLWVVGAIGVAATVACVGLGALVPWSGRAPGFETQTRDYMWARAPAALLSALYSVYRCHLSSVGRPGPALLAIVVANLVNLACDLLFVFTFDWGATGVGMATSLSSATMLVICAAAIPDRRVSAKLAPVRADMAQILGLGIPIALQVSAEMGIFSAVAALIALSGPVALAGHQVAINLASLAFMAAAGIAVAGTARVGHHVGAGESPLARQAGFLAVGFGVVFMASAGLVFFLAAEPIAAAFAPAEVEVRALAARLLRIAAAFAIFDGVQAVAAGILRGLGDTKSPLVANLFAYLVVGFPVAIYLGWGRDWGAAGYWWGLTAGLATVASLLLYAFHRESLRPVQRVEAPRTDGTPGPEPISSTS